MKKRLASHKKPYEELADLLEELFATAANLRDKSGAHRFATLHRGRLTGRSVRDHLDIDAATYSHWRNGKHTGQDAFTRKLIELLAGAEEETPPADSIVAKNTADVRRFWSNEHQSELEDAIGLLKTYLQDLELERIDREQAKSASELERAAIAAKKRLAELLTPIALLRPGPVAKGMLENYPPDQAYKWLARTVDGAIEIFNSPKGSNPYGGLSFDRISCEAHNLEWPDDYGRISAAQRSALSIGLVGDETQNIKGWLQQKGSPGRIRVLRSPISPPVLDRRELILEIGNSDYFTVRSITELSRLNRNGLGPKLIDVFPQRWSQGLSGSSFDTSYIPYHLSVQAVVICRWEERDYLLLGSVNTAHASLTTGWGATIAEQMWAPDRQGAERPWWDEAARKRLKIVQPADTRHGDRHIRDTLERGLYEELGLKLDSDCAQEPVLLNGAIEEDMYFITFIFMVQVELPLDEVYNRWLNAPDHQELGLLAAYQLSGLDMEGKMLRGARRLAELLSQDQFDAGPYLLLEKSSDRIIGPWHPSSRLRMYAAGMHLWPEEFPRYVRLGGR